MTFWTPITILAGILALVGGIVALILMAEKKRREALRRASATVGFSFQPTPAAGFRRKSRSGCSSPITAWRAIETA